MAPSFVDPSHIYTARGDASLRSRRGPYRAPNGALYTHLQHATSSGFAIFKSADDGVSWERIHTFTRGVSGWAPYGNIEQADMVQASAARHLLFLAYAVSPAEGDIDYHEYTGTVRLTVLDTTDDSVAHYDGPTMHLSNPAPFNAVRASVVLVAPSPDGTQAHLVYTRMLETDARVGTALWSGSISEGGDTGDSGPHVQPLNLINVGASKSVLVVSIPGSPDKLRAYVLSGGGVGGGQDLESGALAGGRLLTGSGAAYSAGDWKICIPVPHTHPTAESNYTPAGLVGTYDGSSLAWHGSTDLTSGSDVGSYHVANVGPIMDVASHMAAVASGDGFLLYWAAATAAGAALVSPVKLQRARYSGGSWGAAETVYDHTSSADVNGTNMASYPTPYGPAYFGGFADLSGSDAGLLIHPNMTDFDFPDSFWASPYYLPLGVGPANRYYAM